MTAAIYRLPGRRVPDMTLVHRGPRHKCPVCGNGEHHWKRWGVRSGGDVVSHGPTEPLAKRHGWFVRLFFSCKIRGWHLHQECANCQAKWTCLPMIDAPTITLGIEPPGGPHD